MKQNHKNIKIYMEISFNLYKKSSFEEEEDSSKMKEI